MLEPAVVCTGINKAGKSQLLDIPQTLKPLMFNKIIDEIARNAYKSIDRIIDNLSFIRDILHRQKL
jgi:predicted ATPase